MAVWPFGKATDQPILCGQDETPVLVKVCILENIQQLEQERVRCMFSE